MEQDPMIVNQYLLYNQEFIGTEPRTGIVLPVIDFELPTKNPNAELLHILEHSRTVKL
jgi:hypothetical protein